MAGIYRAGKLEPVADINGRVVLLDSSGITGDSPTGVFEVTWVDALYGLGPHGTVLLWSQSTTPPAGYGTSVPSGATSGTITKGSSTSPNPAIFNLARGQLAQLRWQIKVVGTLTGVVDDLDITFAVPQASPRGQLLNGQSRWNSRFQIVQPSDTAVAPAQGANQANPAAPTSISPPDWTNLTEFFCHEQDFSPTWTITNNGSADLTTAMAVTVDVFGFRIDLAPIAVRESHWVQRIYQGKSMWLPPDVVFVPLAGRPTAAQSQKS